MRSGLVVVGAALALAAGCSSTVSGTPETSGSASTSASRPTTGGNPPDVMHREISTRNHVEGAVRYPESPPMGGDHDLVWADCTGKVYATPIRNENAVHSLEHGAVWVTYRPGLDKEGLSSLTALVDGKNYTFMSPYLGLDHQVSVQSWGYQLKTDDPTDPRIATFISTYRSNPKTTPEMGASCVNPRFGG
jgi:hypothetical protein